MPVRSSPCDILFKYEYAEQASLCGDCVLLVNPFCADVDATDAATGGAVCFRNSGIATEIPAGNSEMMFVEV